MTPNKLIRKPESTSLETPHFAYTGPLGKIKPKMTSKQSILFTTLIISILHLTFSCSGAKSKMGQSKNTNPVEIIELEYPETYELANIILALTEYGLTDKWEVRKNFDYYDKVQKYFEPMKAHPLLDSVNYSREQWENYLSFRSDAYAFQFDQDDKLIRVVDFYTNEGFHPFDDHLDLINDFVKESNFREFFAQNKQYHNALSDEYRKTQYLKEMRQFLIKEFGEQYSINQKYKIVLSPFVYRMNCHRNIDSLTVADFITIPDYIVVDSVSATENEVANSIHMLFTEMDHGYVNPTTEKWQDMVIKNFDPELWDSGSGYNEDSKFGTFNEYMTWAVYDIFLQQYFPDIADEVGFNWSIQNESRGFEYSRLFTNQLLVLYNQKENNETIKDLYPKMLEWTAKVQNDLTKPKIISPKDSIQTKFSENSKITILFSEPMKKTDTITTILQDGKKMKKYIDLNVTDNNLKWTNQGKKLEFEISLPNDRDTYYLQFNWRGIKYPLLSEKGVMVKRGIYFKVKDD